FEDAQHVQKPFWTTEVADEKRSGESTARRGDPSRVADEIAIGAGDLRRRSEHRRRPGRAAHEKVRGHFPCPHRLLEKRQAVVAAIGLHRLRVAPKLVETLVGDQTPLTRPFGLAQMPAAIPTPSLSRPLPPHSNPDATGPSAQSDSGAGCTDEDRRARGKTRECRRRSTPSDCRSWRRPCRPHAIVRCGGPRRARALRGRRTGSTVSDTLSRMPAPTRPSDGRSRTCI